MIVEQLYTNCLSEASYFIADNGAAAVIDPLRDIDEYIQLARKHKVTIKYIFETHFHADFVSGHLDLAKQTGATIIYGPETNAAFAFHKAIDGEEFPIGNLKIKAIHTPGHTLESTCYLLIDENNQPNCIFTGDTLFVGDVGRPDLFSGNLSKEELGGMMYDSLNTKIKTLNDNIVVYPAHGPGSACGKKMGKETFTTIGVQKKNNYALKAKSKEEFIQLVTSGLNTPPAYFPINAKMNSKGYESIDNILKKSLTPLSVPEFEKKFSGEVLILDVRPGTLFTEGFVPESINIGIDGRFAEWAGSLLNYETPILLVAEPGMEEEAITRLARVGFERVIGYLKGGFDAWKVAGKKVDIIIDVNADELAMDLRFDQKLEVVDVRKQTEFDESHVKGAVLLPLDELVNPLVMAQVDDEKNLYVHCAGGYRSVIACSLMKKEGFHNVRNVLGGFTAIKKEKEIPLIK